MPSVSVTAQASTIRPSVNGAATPIHQGTKVRGFPSHFSTQVRAIAKSSSGELANVVDERIILMAWRSHSSAFAG